MSSYENRIGVSTDDETSSDTANEIPHETVVIITRRRAGQNIEEMTPRCFVCSVGTGACIALLIILFATGILWIGPDNNPNKCR